jgi:hypothetical protein
MSSIRSLLVLAIASLGIACATTQAAGPAAPSGDGTPEWVLNPLKGCGVGQATNHGNIGLARQAAEGKGRENLAAQLSTSVQGMLKMYQDSGETDGKDYNEEKITSVSKQLVDQNLQGTRTLKVAQVDKQLFAMVCLDPETFAQALDKMNQLSSKQRQFLKARADAEQADLKAEIEAKRAAENR